MAGHYLGVFDSPKHPLEDQIRWQGPVLRFFRLLLGYLGNDFLLTGKKTGKGVYPLGLRLGSSK